MTPHYTLAMMWADSARALMAYRRRKFARLNLGAAGGTVLVGALLIAVCLLVLTAATV